MYKNNNPWFVCHKTVLHTRLRLFCFHFAGGGASFCRDWGNYLPAGIELIAIQLPGREQRYGEPFHTRATSVVDTLLQIMIENDYLDAPCVFFGHSMGTIISYELIRLIKKQHLEQPLLYIPSGMKPPHLSNHETPIHALPDLEFCREFLKKEHSDRLESIFNDDEMRDFFLPMIKADTELVETYTFEDATPFDCPITAFTGVDDQDVPEAQLLEWARHTTGTFKYHCFPGDHFYIETAKDEMLSTLNREISRFL